MTPTTRYLCPLCDWHHDETDPDFSNPDATHPFVEQDWASGIDGLVAGLVAGRAAVVEAAVRAHLETHPLIEWARALAEARRERDELQARIDAVDWPALHEVVSAEQEQRQRYDRHNAGRCPMCGQEGTGGWICETDMVDVVRPMRGPQRRAWRRFERPRGKPVQGSGYTVADLLGAPLRTPATAEATPLPTQATPPDCRWPACLSERQQQMLAAQVDAGMRGEPTVPMPDQRIVCGCVDGGPDLTREELQDLVDDQGTDLYQARDLLDFIREMCDQRDASGTPITTADVRDWLGYTGCGGVIVLPDDAVAKLATAGAAPLRTPATTSGESPDKAVTSDNGPDIAGEQP